MICSALLRRLAASCFAVFVPLAVNLALTEEALAKSKNMVIVQASKLPEQARLPGESMLLHSDPGGATYLYVEQQQGRMLAVFDVTDPGKIKLASSLALDVPGPFDFVKAVDGRWELIRFRDGRGVGVLDLRRAKSPSVRSIREVTDPQSADSLGASVLLVASSPDREPVAVPYDYVVLDTSASSDAAVLATVKQVTCKAVNPDTGTVFLLGSEGISVIRHLDAEKISTPHMSQ
jgi:hypothetical protein